MKRLIRRLFFPEKIIRYSLKNQNENAVMKLIV